MSHLSPTPRPASRNSLLSNTTYHSFHDAEVYQEPNQGIDVATFEPAKQAISNIESGFKAGSTTEHTTSSCVEMHRQDSGYASTSPKLSMSTGMHARRRTSTITTSGSGTSGRGKKSRPSSTRRSSNSNPAARLPKYVVNGNGSMLPAMGTHSSHYNSPASYFQFPSWDGDLLGHAELSAEAGGSVNGSEDAAAQASAPPPPQTTHYWTSDQTRRLEYAAIDAASQGFKGWIRRHVIPDCFVPKESRRIGFDDDAGSVRRYRIKLESDDATEKVNTNVSDTQAGRHWANKKGGVGSWMG